MNILLSIPKQIRPLLHAVTNQQLRQKEKVVVVVGATGTGKSRLSIDLATRFAAEVINSDKIQAYRGLDIATNKITDEERRGVPHHLLGVVDPDSDFPAASFRDAASLSVRSILRRSRLPIIAGGSNSFVEALVDPSFQSRYDCCFLWVDVAMPVLHSFVSDRVDRMVDRGMVDEVREFYKPSGDYSKGIRRAIGVPELDGYFRSEPYAGAEAKSRALAAAIELVKMNTSRLACRQLEKIQRLRKIRGWKMHRLDATDVFRTRGEEAVEAAWESKVAGPGAAVVRRFLYDMVVTLRGGVGPAVMATAAPH